MACAGVYVRVGGLHGCGCVRWLQGPLDVWGVSHWCGFDLGGVVCIMKGVRFKGKPRQRGGGRVRGRRPRENE